MVTETYLNSWQCELTHKGQKKNNEKEEKVQKTVTQEKTNLFLMTWWVMFVHSRNGFYSRASNLVHNTQKINGSTLNTLTYIFQSPEDLHDIHTEIKLNICHEMQLPMGT
jgi:oligoribonuclease (3'-5' exoribonuclease)